MPAVSALRVALISGLALSIMVPLTALAQPAPSQPGDKQAQPPQRQRGNNNDQRRGQDRGPGGGGQQFGGGFGGLGRGGEPGVSEDDLKSYAAILKLDKSQSEAAKLLLDAHRQELADQQQVARDVMDTMRREAREAPDPAAFGKIAAKMQTFRAERQKMETQFMDDLKATLTPEQAAKWPLVEQARRRDKTMSRGLMAGERVDVIKAVDRLKLDDKAKSEIAPVLQQYAADLDKELVTRNQLTDAAQASAAELMAAMDMAKITKMWEDIRAASSRVRDVNRRYARQIEPMLPEGQREAFSEAARRDSYPTIYRAGPASRGFEKISTLSDLTDEQKASIKTVREGFDRELLSMQKQMEAAYDQRESSIKPEEIVASLMGQRAGGGGGGGRGGLMNLLDSEQMSKLREQRRTMESATLEKINAVLTPEQRTLIAEPAERGKDGGNGDRPRRRGQPQDGQRNPQRPSQQS